MIGNELSDKERHVMMHALGNLCYRNRYHAAGDAVATWDSLVERGLACKSEDDPYPLYHVTEEGFAALTGLPLIRRPDPLPKKPRPGQPPAPAILYRDLQGDGSEDVLAAATEAGWGGLITSNRTAFPRRGRGALPAAVTWPPAQIIGRYSVLPFYRETEADLALLGYRLANSYDQHDFCADIKRWYPVLADYTPKTYTEGWDRLPEGAYVLKGATNSRKHKWNTHMYAATKADVPTVFGRLLGDSLIAPQGVVAREYVPLRQLGAGINDLPFTHEYRLFYWGSRFVAGGFYWSSFEDAENFREVPAPARELGDKLAALIAAGSGAWGEGEDEIASTPYAQFFVLDVAETAAGDWILIEVNDGQMSGLSEIDPVHFYRELWAAVNDSERLGS